VLGKGQTDELQVLLFEKPLIEFAYDTDSKKSAQTRVRILDMLASTRTPLLAYHFRWPASATRRSRATASAITRRRWR